MNIANKIKQIMKAKGLSVEDIRGRAECFLGRRVFPSQVKQMISVKERLTGERLIAVASILEVPLSDLAGRVTIALALAKLTKTEAAKKMGKSIAAFSQMARRIESGLGVNNKNLVALAKVTGQSPEYFLTPTEVKPTKTRGRKTRK